MYLNECRVLVLRKFWPFNYSAELIQSLGQLSLLRHLDLRGNQQTLSKPVLSAVAQLPSLETVLLEVPEGLVKCLNQMVVRLVPKLTILGPLPTWNELSISTLLQIAARSPDFAIRIRALDRVLHLSDNRCSTWLTIEVTASPPGIILELCNQLDGSRLGNGDEAMSHEALQIPSRLIVFLHQLFSTTFGGRDGLWNALRGRQAALNAIARVACCGEEVVEALDDGNDGAQTWVSFCSAFLVLYVQLWYFDWTNLLSHQRP